MAYRILIVDDEIEVVTMLQSFLRRSGYQALYALDGAEASIGKHGLAATAIYDIE